jgi:hypothetical protein
MYEPLSPIKSCHVADFCSGKGKSSLNNQSTVSKFLTILFLGYG